MTWWQRIKIAWTIFQLIKPTKHAGTVTEIVSAVESVVKKQETQ